MSADTPFTPSTEEWPEASSYETFELYALACSLWVERHPDAYLFACILCHKPVMFYSALPPAVQPGHIYSDAGSREFNITRMCEYCFDAAAQAFEDGPTPLETPDEEFDDFLKGL